MRLSMIAAVARNGVIGSGNKLPWYLPEDLKYFKRMTLGKPIIMGRKTYESIGRPLPGRTNIVLTLQADWDAEGVTVVASIEDAIAVAKAGGALEAVVIGGGQVYRLAMELADCLYLTEVEFDVEGDAFFPDFDKTEWLESNRSEPENINEPAYQFVTLVRKS